MAGQMVSVAGVLVAPRVGQTKSRKPFVTATLEDLVGSVDITCWSEVYERTEELWVEGNILLVQGRVKMRQDSVQLVCDQVREYKPDEVETQPAVAAGPPSRRGRLNVILVETENPDEDIARLERAIDVLKSYPGDDRVLLNICNSAGKVCIEMTGMGVAYCPELRLQLTGTLGDEALKFEEN
jgi:DNA polymerase III alpha subunit